MIDGIVFNHLYFNTADVISALRPRFGVYAAGSFESRLADLSLSHTEGSFSLTMTGRIDTGRLDPSIADRTEYTSNPYYSDRRLWGGFVDNPDLEK